MQELARAGEKFDIVISFFSENYSTEEEVREILRNAVRDEGPPPSPLGSRLQARFAGIGLDHDLPELRGEVARPARFEE